MLSAVVEGHETQLKDVIQDVVNLNASDQQLQTKIESLSTNGKWCAYRYGPWTTTSTITYDILTFSDTNMDITGTPLDINTGKITKIKVFDYQMDIIIFVIFQGSSLYRFLGHGG